MCAFSLATRGSHSIALSVAFVEWIFSKHQQNYLF